jgi:hypothetical protein
MDGWIEIVDLVSLIHDQACGVEGMHFPQTTAAGHKPFPEIFAAYPYGSDGA